MTLAYDPVPDAGAPDQRLDDLIFAMGAAVSFRRGEEIFGQAESADLVYQLVEGEVHLSCFAFGGHHTVEVLTCPGHLFGLDPGPEHQMSAEALSDCVVLVASRRGLAFALGEPELDLSEADAAPEPGLERRLN